VKQALSELPLSIDGRSIFARVYDPTAWAYHSAAIDTATWRQVSELKDPSKKFPGFQSATPDQTMCVASDGKHRDALFDMKTGKVIARLDAPDLGFQQHQGFFSPRAKLYVMHDLNQDQEVDTLVAIPSGKRLCQLRSKEWTLAWTFSADESRVAFIERNGIIHVHSSVTGELLRKLGRANENDEKWKWVWSALALSPDTNLLAAQTENAAVVQVWDLRSGKLHRSLTLDLQVGRADGACLAWSPDNRVLAVGGLDNSVRLWEMASGQIRSEFRGHVCPARCLAYLLDGQFLVSGGEDATLLVWKPLPDKRTRDPLTADTLSALWEDLGAEAGKAFEALAELRHAPKSTVPFLAKHLQPQPAIDAKQVGLWLRDLDNKKT
jgi:WD40 repeat protein